MFEEESEEEWFSPDFKKQLDHFERMYAEKEYDYFDSNEIEFILDHLIISNQLRRARWAAEGALKHFPTNSTIIVRYSQILSMTGDINSALKILLDLERIEPYNLDVLLSIATCYSQLKNNTTSVKYFQRAFALSSGEEKVEIAIDLAMEYENLDNFKMAISVLKEAIEEGCLNDLLVYELAHCYEKNNDFDNAITCFLDYIDEEPYSYTTWYNLGNIYAKIGKYNEAIWAFEYAIIINDSFIPAIYNLANTYLDYNQIDKALETYRTCLELDEDDPMVLCSMGECYEELGEIMEAYMMYDKSTQLLPQLTEAWLGKGIVSGLLGKYERAIKEILIVIDLEPEKGDYWHALGNAYENNKQDILAIEAYKKAVELDPQAKEIAIDYLLLLASVSEDLVFKALEENPQLNENKFSKLTLCYCHWKIGNQSESMLIFDDLIQEDTTLAKSLFLHFPEMKKIDYFIDQIQQLDENNNDEEF